MIFKNKNLFLKIYILFVIIISVALIILQILGSKRRVGYLNDFNLNIDRTLELNNLNDIRKNFITNYFELDEESVINYLLTNQNITNYVYHFRIRYYDKTFRNNDIYGVYPDLSNLPDYIKNVEMDEGGSPYGNFISDKKEIEDKIDNINYTLRIKPKIPILLYFILSLILIIYFYNDIHKFTINTNIYRKYDNFFTEKRFIILIIISNLILFIFQFWLCFPGYYDYPDNHVILLESIKGLYSNANPLIIPLLLNTLYKIFGYHTFYIFFINLFLWYGGLTLITISLYLKFKNRVLILLLLISFIGNIFFMNINHLKDTTSSLFVWFAYSIIFFQLLNGNKNLISKIILNIICFLSLILGLLWRHNMIVTIYPIFIFYSFMIIKKINIKNIKIKILSFVLSMGIFAVMLVLIVKLCPLIFRVNPNKHMTNNGIINLQLAGIAVLSNDPSVIPIDMYGDNTNFFGYIINFENVKKWYAKYPNFADPYISFFNILNSNNALISVYFKAIIKHPIAYFKHTFNYSKGYLTTKSGLANSKAKSYAINTTRIQSKNEPLDIEKNENYFWLNRGVEFNKLKFSIYSFIYNSSICFEIYIYAFLSLILFVFSIVLNIKYRLKIDLLVFLFSIVSSSIATILILLLFTPLPDYRYMYPIIPVSILSLISFITFIYDRVGFKKFFKELRGEKK